MEGELTMGIFERIKGTVIDKRKLEHLESDNEKMRATIDYIACMNDIEIPSEDENNERIVEDEK